MMWARKMSRAVLLFTLVTLDPSAIAAQTGPTDRDSHYSPGTLVALRDETSMGRVFHSFVLNHRITVVLQSRGQTYAGWFETISDEKARDLRNSLCQKVQVEISDKTMKLALSNRRLKLRLTNLASNLSNPEWTKCENQQVH